MNGYEKLGLIVLLVAVSAAINVTRFSVGQYTRLTGVANFPKWIERIFHRPNAEHHQS